MLVKLFITCPMASSQMITSKKPMMGARYLIPLEMKMTRIVRKRHIADAGAEDHERQHHKGKQRGGEECFDHDYLFFLPIADVNSL
jgi:hypothetical protein